MRVELVVTLNRNEAAEKCPWAAKIVAVDHGFLCFESIQDYDTWRNQL